MALSQTSGGQITRKSTVIKRENQINKPRKTTSTINHKSEAEVPRPIIPDIQPIPIGFLKTYNIVIGTFGLLSNAQTFCKIQRDRGYSAEIYFDSSKEIYRVLIGFYENEQYALDIRDRAKEKYPDAWILYIVNGREERYYK